MMLDLVDERITRFHPGEIDLQPAAAQEVLHELGVRNAVLEQKNTQFARRGRCFGSVQWSRGRPCALLCFRARMHRDWVGPATHRESAGPVGTCSSGGGWLMLSQNVSRCCRTNENFRN